MANQNWDNQERKKEVSGDHDLLIRIDENMTNFLIAFTKHVEDDKENFTNHKKQLETLQKGYWMTIGAITLIGLFFKVLK